MPLGDSITRGIGSTDLSGYRKELLGLLTGQSGYEVDFVGSLQDGPNTFDNQHEGHGGATAFEIAAGTPGWLSAATAVDIVLLHAGTNDLQNPLADPDSVANDVDRILNAIDGFSTNTWVVLAQIIDTCPSNTKTHPFNNSLLALFNARKSTDKIVLVNQESALVCSNDFADDLHPNDTGYAKMADVWLGGLQAILPTAVAGPDQEANAEITVTLDGTGSTAALGTVVGYSWSQIAGSPAVRLTNPATSKASFSAPGISGNSTLTFELTVTFKLSAAPTAPVFTNKDTCRVTVNGLPVADAGSNQVANPGAAVVLDGSASNDPGGAIAAYLWQQVSGTPVVTLAGTNTARASFTAPAGGSAELAFMLTVTDNKGAQDNATSVVLVNGPSPGASGGGGGGGGCFIGAAEPDFSVGFRWVAFVAISGYFGFRRRIRSM
jgi:lysophospholipase L1-like esterase